LPAVKVDWADQRAQGLVDDEPGHHLALAVRPVARKQIGTGVVGDGNDAFVLFDFQRGADLAVLVGCCRRLRPSGQGDHDDAVAVLFEPWGDVTPDIGLLPGSVHQDDAGLRRRHGAGDAEPV
jgi:hypothetical protein